MQSILHEVAPVIDRDDSHSARKPLLIEAFDLFGHLAQNLRRVLAPAHQYNAFHPTRGPVHSEAPRGRSKAHLHMSYVADINGCSTFAREKDVCNIARSSDQANSPDDHRLLLVVEERAAGIAIVRVYGVCYTRDAEAILLEQQRIDFDLILLHEPPKGTTSATPETWRRRGAITQSCNSRRRMSSKLFEASSLYRNSSPIGVDSGPSEGCALPAVRHRATFQVRPAGRNNRSFRTQTSAQPQRDRKLFWSAWL